MKRINLPKRNRVLPTYTSDTVIGKNFKFVKYSKITESIISLEDFTQFVQHIVSSTNPDKISFRHNYTLSEFHLESWEWRPKVYSSYITFTPRKHGTFANFVHALIERRYTELYGDDYNTYANSEVIAEDIDGSSVIAVHSLLGHGGYRDRVRSTIIGTTEYLIQSVDGPDSECFFNILRKYSPLVDDLIASLDIDGLGIHPEDLSYMSDNLKYMGLCINTTVNGEHVTYGCGLHVKMLCVSGHWWEIINEYQIETLDSTEIKQSGHFFAYDFETVTNEPYMFSTYDPINGCRVIETDEPGCQEFMTKVAAVMAEYEAEGYTGVGFNSNYYDDMYLLRILPPRKCVIKKGTGNSIIGFQYGKSKLIDVRRFLKMSLSQACQAMNVKVPKQSINHMEVHEKFVERGFVEVTDVMREYSHVDVKCLWDVWFKAKQSFKDVFHLKPDGCISLGQMSYDRFKLLNGAVPQLTEIEWRDFIIGGKCHGEPGVHTGRDIFVLDVNSLYPCVMMNETFIRRAGRLVETMALVWHGLYEVEVLKNPKYHIIPHRQPDGILDWGKEAPYLAKCSGVDIMDHIKRGGEVSILRGWSYENVETSKDMFGFLAEYYEIKKTSKGPVRELAKLLMNALSGKLTQKPITTESFVTHGEPLPGCDYERVGDEVYVSTRPKARATTTGSLINGILIYSYARRLLHDFMYQCDDCFYCDTDSLFTTTRLKTGVELGEMKEEAEGDELIVVGKKMYTLRKNGEVMKAALKGVRYEGFFEDDTERTKSDTWLVRCVEKGLKRFRVRMDTCSRTEFAPKFVPIQKVITLSE